MLCASAGTMGCADAFPLVSVFVLTCLSVTSPDTTLHDTAAPATGAPPSVTVTTNRPRGSPIHFTWLSFVGAMSAAASSGPLRRVGVTGTSRQATRLRAAQTSAADLMLNMGAPRV